MGMDKRFGTGGRYCSNQPCWCCVFLFKPRALSAAVPWNDHYWDHNFLLISADPIPLEGERRGDVVVFKSTLLDEKEKVVSRSGSHWPSGNSITIKDGSVAVNGTTAGEIHAPADQTQENGIIWFPCALTCLGDNLVIGYGQCFSEKLDACK